VIRWQNSKGRGGHEINRPETLYRPCWTQDEHSLEDAFWEGLKEIAKTKRMTLSDLVGGIHTQREQGNLSSAIRLFVLSHYQKRATSDAIVDTFARAAEYTNVQ
jgi:predicted DNA-binding ribbon-helix-helix protein